MKCKVPPGSEINDEPDGSRCTASLSHMASR